MMNKLKSKSLKFATLAIFSMIVVSSCERDISSDVVPATFPNTGEIYTDAPVSLTDEFFISFDPAGGANTNGFGTDENEAFLGSSSIRIDVPAANDPDGGFIGGIFRDRGNGRDLTNYDALTFWAKGSTTGTIGQVGFGTDFLNGQYPASRANIQLSTDWRKYIVPIPDPSKLVQERGVFLFAAGGVDIVDNIPNGNEIGWTFWLDEIKFEKLGTIAQPRPAIFNGSDIIQSTFNSTTIEITGLTQTFNVGTGADVTVSASPAYFTFQSTEQGVAVVNQDEATVSVISEGESVITARLAGVEAEGSLKVVSAGDFPQPPIPTIPQSDVISLFSNSYDDVPVDTFRADFGSTGFEFISVDGNDVLSYSSLDFVGVQFQNPTVDASDMDFMHMDLFTTSTTSNNFVIQIRDRGANGEINTNIFTGQPEQDDKEKRFTLIPSDLTQGQWISIDIPLNGGLASQKNNLAQLVFVGDIDFIADNLYFYKQQ